MESKLHGKQLAIDLGADVMRDPAEALIDFFIEARKNIGLAEKARVRGFSNEVRRLVGEYEPYEQYGRLAELVVDRGYLKEWCAFYDYLRALGPVMMRIEHVDANTNYARGVEPQEQLRRIARVEKFYESIDIYSLPRRIADGSEQFLPGEIAQDRVRTKELVEGAVAAYAYGVGRIDQLRRLSSDTSEARYAAEAVMLMRVAKLGGDVEMAQAGLVMYRDKVANKNCERRLGLAKWGWEVARISRESKLQDRLALGGLAMVEAVKTVISDPGSSIRVLRHRR